ncbi:hypothetical protein SEMRO_1721_G293500.1 [Seminavis robusta]|uniref:Uncharacterized protein n=1 Tax=Seminavis robusta TaxID=568900 RepID=A0A9N8EST1_9STRA|nr:hypothetical protein SEMRO_1721_G293500.1 [Seminavis robusta]|eukprot:Sro1721_g293500.1 n/a (245) ;mRNA; r:248-982
MNNTPERSSAYKSWSDMIGSSTKLGNKIVKGLIKEFAPTQNPLQDPVPEDNDLLQQMTNKVTPQNKPTLENEEPDEQPQEEGGATLNVSENEMDPEEQLEEPGTTTEEHPNELTEEEEAAATSALMNSDTNGKADSQDNTEQPNKPGNPGSTPPQPQNPSKTKTYRNCPLYALTPRLKSLDSGTVSLARSPSRRSYPSTLWTSHKEPTTPKWQQSSESGPTHPSSSRTCTNPYGKHLKNGDTLS